jgi:hypothetical protein
MSADAPQATDALRRATRWLLDLQNRDGGFPTFCRGWGALPFDRSSPDITAHCLRAQQSLRKLAEWTDLLTSPALRDDVDDILERTEFLRTGGQLDALDTATARGSEKALRFLMRRQRGDGSWLPLWFGNQHAPDDVNPTYGTAKVLAAYRDCGLLDQEPARRGLNWLRQNQNPDGGWGAGMGTPSSVEETSLAVEALLGDPQAGEHVARGLDWLMDRIESGAAAIRRGGNEHNGSLSPTGDADLSRDSNVGERAGVRGPENDSQVGPLTPPPLPGDDAGGSGQPPAGERGFPPPQLEPAPIGFYFAKLWYFERLYPLIFAVSCLRRAVRSCTSGEEG